MNISTPAEAIAWLKTVRHFNCTSVISIIESALAREAALREELVSANSDKEAYGQNAISLRQRLTVAEQRVQKMVDCSKGQDSIATGYLSDILALLKPAAEGEGS